MKLRESLITLAAAAGLLGTALTAASATTRGSEMLMPIDFIAECDWSHTSTDDPILAYEGIGPHQHNFFGNQGTDVDTTPDTLRNGLVPGPTTCDRALNESAYWTPALYAPAGPGELTPTHSRNYNRTGGIDDVESIGIFHYDFSMIAGNAGSTDPWAKT